MQCCVYVYFSLRDFSVCVCVCVHVHLHTLALSSSLCFEMWLYLVWDLKKAGKVITYLGIYINTILVYFVLFLHFMLFPVLSLALLLPFPFIHRCWPLFFLLFFLFAFFLLIYLIHPYFFPWPLLNRQILITSLDSFLYQLSTPSFLLPSTWPSHNPDIVSVQNFHSVFQPQLLSPPASATWFH